jgi:hypothetical protein
VRERAIKVFVVRTALGMRYIKGKYNKRTELAWRINKSLQKASGEQTST